MNSSLMSSNAIWDILLGPYGHLCLVQGKPHLLINLSHREHGVTEGLELTLRLVIQHQHFVKGLILVCRRPTTSFSAACLFE